MRILVYIVVAVVVVVLAIVGVGYSLPVKHVATMERSFTASPAAVFAAISTPTAFPEWRSGVQRVEILPDVGGQASFKEIGGDGDITYVVDEREPDRRLVTRIAD